jgi:hypothetical protein
MSYIDADGKPVLKVPTWPVRRVGYYWKMHNQKNYKKLVDAHLFYQLDFRHWALGDNDEASDNSYVTDDLDLPVATLEQAVSKYPDRAVMALFNELGLVYSRFQEQVERNSYVLLCYRNGHRTPHPSWNDERRGQVMALLWTSFQSLRRLQPLHPEAIWASCRLRN